MDRDLQGISRSLEITFLLQLPILELSGFLSTLTNSNNEWPNGYFGSSRKHTAFTNLG